MHGSQARASHLPTFERAAWRWDEREQLLVPVTIRSLGARVDNSRRLLSELRPYHRYCRGKPRQEQQNQSVLESAASRGHSSLSDHLHVRDYSVRSCPVTNTPFSVTLLVWAILHNLRRFHAMLGQGLCYQPSLAFYVQDRVLYAAFPLWARSPITILPYMNVRSEPRRESTLVQCSTDSSEHLSDPDTVHVSPTAAAGDRLGYHKVGARRIKWTVAR